MSIKSRPREATPTALPNRAEVVAIRNLLAGGQPTLDDYWSVGKQMHKLEAEPAVSGLPSWRQRVAEAVGGVGKLSTLAKSLQLHKLYPTAAALNDLKRIDNRWSFVLIALGVPGTKQRHALLKKAKDEHWPAERLQAEIQRRNGGVRGGGRARTIPESTAFAPDLQHLLGLLEDLHNFHANVWQEYEEQVTAIASGTEADPGVNAKRLSAVITKVGSLPVTVKTILGQLMKLNGRLTARKVDRSA